ncbi:MAG TPA: alpha/beta hydrolase [Candidatus Eisenbacteria bacterium]|nr:alpha/beta hydrolase [Candidatus Eisenbacteria bacterium]
MAIWRHLLRPLLPWLGRIAVGLVAMLALGWMIGLALIYRAEPETGATLPAGVAGRLVTAGGHTVHVVEAGAGDPLLLVHGFAGSTYDWEAQVLEPLARSHRAIAVDLLGMGFSARGSDLAYGYALWSQQLADVMDALGIVMATVVGHSLGGAVASIFAAEHGGRVEKLVLVAPLVPLEWSERAWFFNAMELPGVGELMLGTADHLPQLPGFDDPYHARAHEIFRIHGTRRALLTYLRHGRDTPRLVAAYRQIVAPTLIVSGTADDVIPHAAVRRWATAIHDALVLPLDGVGHWVMRDAPARLVAAIDDLDRR